MPKSRLVTGACLLCGSFVTSVATADPPTDSPRFELATDPVGLFMGNYVLAAAYALTDHVVARASYSHGDPAMQLTTFHATATAQVFLDRAFHGPFLETGYVWEDDLVGYAALGGSQDAPDYASLHKEGPEMLVGYQWTYAMHLTLSAAAGVMRVLYPSAVGGQAPQPTEYQWYLNAGYVF